MPKEDAAGSPDSIPGNSQDAPPLSNDARTSTVAQPQRKPAKKFQVHHGSREKPVPPTTPAGAVWVPRGDREAIVSAFQHHGVSISVLSARQRRKYKVIESVLRERLDEQEGRIRAMEAEARIHVIRRLAA